MSKGDNRLLVADGNEMNRQILASRLAQQGYKVTVATDGYLALGMLDIRDFDLVFLDVALPKIGGYELLKRIKAHELWRHIPVIMTTERSDMECAARCIQMGAEDCLTKPFNSIYLLARVTASLEKRQQQKAVPPADHAAEAGLMPGASGARINSGKQHVSQDALFALAKLVESRDADKGAHLERTREYCSILCHQLQLHPRFIRIVTDEFVENLCLAAPLHDIGQIKIPEATLLRQGQPSDAEWDIIRAHPVIGAETLRSIQSGKGETFMQIAIHVVESHHEKWDGSGYPAGLKGEQIPMAARIFALADAYDALTSRLCYKPAVTHQQACHLIMKERGRHFDPDVVDAFMAVHRDFLSARRAYPDALTAQLA